MISVCIPIYNYFALPLVQELARQRAAIQDEEVEIVCIDDASTAQHRLLNANITSSARLLLLDNNVGRAAIRNLFLQYTQGDYLLFLDNDMEVSSGFLQRYVDSLKLHPQVVVGGIAYRKRRGDKEHALRYMYGTQVESRSLEQRQHSPYRSFMTGNFMVQRAILESHPFDQSLKGYGHEDTLFGYNLKRDGIIITHIDNPAINGQVETNEEFLHKTQESVRNLSMIYSQMGDNDDFCNSVRLLATYKRLLSAHVLWAVEAAFRLLRKPLESHFIAGNAISVTQFSFYKLGLFIENNKSYHKPQQHASQPSAAGQKDKPLIKKNRRMMKTRMLLFVPLALALVGCRGGRYVSADSALEELYVGRSYYDIEAEFGRPDATRRDGREGTAMLYNAATLNGTRAATLCKERGLRDKRTKQQCPSEGSIAFLLKPDMRCYAVESGLQVERLKEQPKPTIKPIDRTTPVWAKPRLPRTLDFPEVARRSPLAKVVSIERIELDNKQTTVHFMYKARTPKHRPVIDSGICVHKDLYIEDRATGHRYTMLDADGISLYPKFTSFAHNIGGYDVLVYSVTFPALPANVEYINIIEPGHSGVNFYKVDVRTRTPLLENEKKKNK